MNNPKGVGNGSFPYENNYNNGYADGNAAGLAASQNATVNITYHSHTASGSLYQYTNAPNTKYYGANGTSMFSPRDLVQSDVGNDYFAKTSGGCYTKGPNYIVLAEDSNVSDKPFIMSYWKTPESYMTTLYGPYYKRNCGKTEGTVESATIVYN